MEETRLSCSEIPPTGKQGDLMEAEKSRGGPAGNHAVGLKNKCVIPDEEVLPCDCRECCTKQGWWSLASGAGLEVPSERVHVSER